MKYIIAIIISILLATVTYAAEDIKLTALTKLAQGNDDLLVYVVTDPNGSPLERKIPWEELILPWDGTENITVLGTIATGVWSGTSILNAKIDWSDIDYLATEGAIVVTDTADATTWPCIFADATGNEVAYTDGALTYAADTGTLAATEFSGGGGSLTAIDAATGDSATAFFDAGTIEHERGGIEADISAIADGGMLVGTGAGTMAIRASYMTAGAAGTITHELGGLQADVSGWTGLFGITGADTSVEVDTFAELDTAIADKSLVNQADGATWTGTHDYGGADLELPQASPAVPGVDGGIELDFTDGKMVIQHGSAHAELGASTDIAIGTLIRSWSGTIFEPDGVNDVLTIKAVNSVEYPHGIVITAIYLGISSDDGYVLTVQNFDDFDTINAGDPTIDIVTYAADTTGEIIDTAPTFATIAAGQLIMLSIPATDVDWIHFEIYYYEPAA